MALVLLLGFGVLAAIAAAIKTSKIPLLAIYSDTTRDTLSVLTWAGTECCIIIVAACIPTLRPLFQDLARKAGLAKWRKCLYCSGEQFDNDHYYRDSNIRGNLKTIYSRTSSQATLTFNEASIRVIPIRQTSGSTIQTVNSDTYEDELKTLQSTSSRTKGGRELS